MKKRQEESNNNVIEDIGDILVDQVKLFDFLHALEHFVDL